jgi:hypothetical protein
MAIVAAGVVALSASAETIRLSGDIRTGETCSHQLRAGLMFCLVPEFDYAFNIQIAVACEPGAHNFAAIATPPYYGVNPTQLMSSHFVSGAQILPKIRSFRFVLSDQDFQTVWSMLRRDDDAGQLLKLVSRLGRGAGELRVLKTETTPGSASSPTLPRLVHLRFSARFILPDD